MLRFARALGFLAPLAVTLCASVVLVLTSGGDALGRSWVLSAVVLAALAGMTTTALAAWSYMGWRLNRLAKVLESTLTDDTPAVVREAGIPAERRLARAFNAAAGAFLQFEARATHDRLTGVANRETLLTVLLAEVERASRHYKPLSVAFIDIDRFKPINDTFGHQTGDTVLSKLSDVLSRIFLRKNDLVARYGGDELAVVLRETTVADAKMLADRLLRAVRAVRIEREGTSIGLTVSIGVAELQAGETAAAWLERSDRGLYKAKNAGRDQVVAEP